MTDYHLTLLLIFVVFGMSMYTVLHALQIIFHVVRFVALTKYSEEFRSVLIREYHEQRPKGHQVE